TCVGDARFVSTLARGVELEASAGEVFYVFADSPTSGCASGWIAVAEVAYDEVGRCADGVDNDEDWSADCLDADCAGASVCDEAAQPGACSNGRDDDRDGVADCLDDDCAGQPACDEAAAGGDACDDGVDEDGDGRTDCDDAQC